jgi:hypothetical protein
MIKFPIHGFAKRAEDTVPKAMAIIRAKESAVDGERMPLQPPRKQDARGKHA